MKLQKDSLKTYLLLLLLCISLFGPGLTTIPPVDRDEPRYAQATHQMLETHDFVRIRFQDEPRHKKPIGIYWLQAAAVKVTGMAKKNNIWPYRIPSLIGAVVAVLLTFVFGKSLFNSQTAKLGAALLAASLLLVVESHLATTDAVLLATIVATLGALGCVYVRIFRGQSVGFGTLVLFWVAQGVGILVKGPVVPLVSSLTIVSLLIVDRSVRLVGQLRLLWGIPLAAAIVCLWAIPVSLATSHTFFQDAFSSDLWPKITSGQEMHGFPPGFYLLLLIFTFWPGSLFASLALFQAWKHRSSFGERFCLAWIIPTWFVFELIPTKLPHYILPLYPALALLVARAILSRTTNSFHRTFKVLVRVGLVIWSAVGLLFAAGIMAIPLFIDNRFNPLTLWPVAGAIFIVFLTWHYTLRNRLVKAAVSAIILSVLILAPTTHIIIPHVNALWLSQKAAEAVKSYSQSSSTSTPVVAAAGYHEPSLVFLLGTNTKLVSAEEAALHLNEHPGGLALISDKEDEAFLQKMSGLRRPVRELKTIHGYNYTKGQWFTLKLYATKQNMPE